MNTIDSNDSSALPRYEQLEEVFKASTAVNPIVDRDSKVISHEKQENIEIPFLSTCATLIQGCRNSKDSPELIRKLLEMHRIEQNTKARRRLERWVTRLIVIYLLVVLGVFLFYAVGSNLYFKGVKIGIEISDAVMVTILSTTTVNIIGLAIILVRGLFPGGNSSRFTSFEDKEPQ